MTTAFPSVLLAACFDVQPRSILCLCQLCCLSLLGSSVAAVVHGECLAHLLHTAHMKRAGIGIDASVAPASFDATDNTDETAIARPLG